MYIYICLYVLFISSISNIFLAKIKALQQNVNALTCDLWHRSNLWRARSICLFEIDYNDIPMEAAFRVPFHHHLSWLYAAISQNSLDCTGLKIDPFCNRWAYIAVFGLLLKWKSQAIA